MSFSKNKMDEFPKKKRMDEFTFWIDKFFPLARNNSTRDSRTFKWQSSFST